MIFCSTLELLAKSTEIAKFKSTFLGSKVFGKVPPKILTDFVTHLYMMCKILEWFPIDPEIQANLH